MNTITDTNNEQDDLGVLRFITAGSVDDGKSTLIGRLLFDSKGIFIDQLAAISRSKHKRTQGEQIDLSLLTDGLEAEREQGITIDVAYRYFATPRRKFIVADAPGHEQYTRNMITGASTADAVVILIDPTRIRTEESGTDILLTQTKRHSAIAKLLGLPHVIVAINKMDLVGWDQALFERIRSAYAEFAAQLGLTDVYYIPLSALEGDNVVNGSDAAPWYSGPTLLEVLETLEPRQPADDVGLRFPVQYVQRTYPEGQENADPSAPEVFGFRGYQGRIEAGSVKPGDAVTILPAGTSATVHEVLRFEGPMDEAVAGQSVTILLKENVDVSRGDLIVASGKEPVTTKRLQADLCWLDTTPLDSRRRYLLKQTSRVVQAKIQEIEFVLDVHALQDRIKADTLAMNDIAQVRIALAQPIAADSYATLPATGAFILIDAGTNQTAAAGMILAVE